MATHSPSYTQALFRFRNDDGSESAATWIAAADTNITRFKGANRVVRLRVRVAQTVSNANTDLAKTLKVRRSINGGAYADVGAQGAAAPIRYFDSTGVTHQGTTTNQLSTSSFVAGRIDEQGNSGTITFTDSAVSATEVEFVLEIVDAQVSNSDTIDLRVYQTDDVALASYTVTPRVTIAVPAPPTAPSGVAATSVADPVVTWADNSSDETAFYVHRVASGAGAPTDASTRTSAALAANAVRWVDQTAAPSTAYDYYVEAVNAHGSSFSASAGSATTPAAWPKVGTLADDFNDNSLDAGKWGIVLDPPGQTVTVASEVNQQLEVVYDGSGTAGIAEIVSQSRYDLTDSEIFVDLKQWTLLSGTQAGMYLAPFSSGVTDRIELGPGGTANLQLNYYRNNSLQTATVAYSGTNHRFLRVRHSVATGLVYWETAPDSGDGTPGTWVERRSVALATMAIGIRGLLVKIGGGPWGTGVSAVTAIFDNVNGGGAPASPHLRLGADPVAAMYLGADPVVRDYLGSQLVFGSPP